MPTTVSDSLQILRFVRDANNAAQCVPQASTDVTGIAQARDQRLRRDCPPHQRLPPTLRGNVDLDQEGRPPARYPE
jgi:hypothetical protein